MSKINLTVSKDGISFSVCKCFSFSDDPQKNKYHMQLLASAIDQRRKEMLLPTFSALFDLQDWMLEENGFFASGKETDVRTDINRLGEILRLSGCPDLGIVINGMMTLKFEDHFGYMPTDDDISDFKEVIVEQILLQD